MIDFKESMPGELDCNVMLVLEYCNKIDLRGYLNSFGIFSFVPVDHIRHVFRQIGTVTKRIAKSS